MWVISISDPAQPTAVGHCSLDTQGYADEVAVAGDFAYVTDEIGGLRIVSVSDPAHPVEVGYYNTLCGADAVALGGSYVYLAEWGGGLRICQFYGAGVEKGETPYALRATPIPTVVRGTLELPQATSPKPQATSWLLDAAGRRVAELHVGQNDVSRLSPGVYFVRSAVGGERSAVGGRGEVHKVIIAR
jgi:hypothetical protein